MKPFSRSEAEKRAAAAFLSAAAITMALVLAPCCAMAAPDHDNPGATPAASGGHPASGAAGDGSMSAPTDASDARQSRPDLFRAWRRFRQAQEVRYHSYSQEELRKRPLLYWRQWASRPLRAVPTFIFIALLSVLASEFIQASLRVAQEYSREHFWRSLFTGILTCMIMMIVARHLFVSEIGTPLALLTLGVLQFLMLSGLVCVSTMISKTLLDCLGLKSDRIFPARPFLRRLVYSLLGAAVITLLAMIPGLGLLPRIGIRLVAMLGLLGMGALLRTRFGLQRSPGQP